MASKESAGAKQFMDDDLYSYERIEAFERIFGRTYISLGGEEFTSKFIKDLNLREDDKVLDVGCGVGGAAFLMAKHYGALVTGVDISSNMINMANKYRGESEPDVKYRCQFHVEDAVTENYPENFFNAAHSRDVIVHISNKTGLFAQIFRALKPGGTLMITDYAMGEVENNSESFLEYVKRHDYQFYTIKNYVKLLEAAGFVDVEGRDITDDMVALSKDELERWEGFKKAGDSKKLAFELEDMRAGWRARIERCSTGEQRWAQYVARKPTK